MNSLRRPHLIRNRSSWEILYSWVMGRLLVAEQMMMWRIRCSLTWFSAGITTKATSADNSGKAKVEEHVERIEQLYSLQVLEVKGGITLSPGQIRQRWVGASLGGGTGFTNSWQWWIFTISLWQRVTNGSNRLQFWGRVLASQIGGHGGYLLDIKLHVT